MNANSEFGNKLKNLADLEPNLAQELQGVESTNQAIERLTTIAGRHGIVLNAAELDVLSAAVTSQARTITALQTLMNKDDTLAQTLEGLDQTKQSVEAIMASAAIHGVTLDVNELTTYLRLTSKNSNPEELSDEALADVTGGFHGIPAFDKLPETERYEAYVDYYKRAYKALGVELNW